jgi:AraC-like DNA-binding protein
MPGFFRRPDTLAITVLAQLVRYLEDQGMDWRGMLARAGIDPDSVDDPDGRIPVEAYIAVEAEAVRSSGDPCFGLKVGAYYRPGSWSIADAVLMNCSSLERAMSLAGRYAKLVSYLIRASARFVPGAVELVFSVPARYPPLSPHCYYTFLASLLTMLRGLTGVRLCPLRVALAGPAPDAAARAEFEAFFGCPVEFGQGRYAAAFDPAVGRLKPARPDPAALDRARRLAEAVLAKLEASGSVVDELVPLIASSLAAGGPSLRAAARELGRSPRALQARLAAEGATYRSLLRDCRRRLALEHFAAGRSVEETAFLLGFADQAAFRKAFRAWTGTTPGAARAAARAAS